MIRSAIGLGLFGLLGVVLLLAACEPLEDPAVAAAAARQARLEKRWPTPAPAANASERVWQAANGGLVLWGPDPTAPPPIPGEALVYIQCAGGSLIFETDIIVAQDVPIPGPPYDTLTLEGGTERLATKLTPRGNGFTSWAAGTFPVSRSQADRLLAGPILVVRPRYTGEPQNGWQEYDAGAQYAAPPPAMRAAFLENCASELPR
jgi:hypothetical protein